MPQFDCMIGPRCELLGFVIEHDPVANLRVIEPLLRESVGAAAHLAFDVDTEWNWAWRARLTNESDLADEVVLRGTLDFFDLTIPKFDVGTQLIGIHWDSVKLPEVIDALADVALEYLAGRYEVASSTAAHGTGHVVYLDTSLGEWTLGRDTSLTPQDW